MHKIIVTGPESTGKTTLSKNLSKHLNRKLVNEFARDYLEKKNNTYNFENLLEIAQNQYKLENQKSKLIVCDTDLLTIKIWSEHKFGKCDKWTLEKINAQKKEQRMLLNSICLEHCLNLQQVKEDIKNQGFENLTIKEIINFIKLNY